MLTRVALAPLLVAAVAVGALLVTPPPAGAAALRVAPLVLDLAMRPGETRTVELSATSVGEPSTVQFEHADLEYHGADYQQRIVEDAAPDAPKSSTRGWFSVDTPRVRLQADRTRLFRLRVSVPDNATPGTHIGLALLRVLPRRSAPTAAQAVASVRTGAIVLVAVQGGTVPEPDIATFTAPRLAQHAPIPMQLTVANDGTRHFDIEGSVTLTGRGHRASVDLPSRLVVPGVDRDLVPDAASSLRLGARDLPWGRYRARVELTVDPGGERLHRELVVWIVPLWMRIAAALLAVAVFAVPAAWLVRRWRG